ncbi:DDE-type integrase/transposase/recombinase [Pseudoalteromonas sp. MT33b]|uniref:DDE-type integrase/transposase/recombinase n=1 Tax=Pseudoalteromonas sp. MT33b TaxID=2759705 RepID=UPI0015FDB397|nr:DDE-type integrase/transposase/recombinase [Pseudoalteromonas sp. MT33b]QMW14129.1 DDE-type integrase/transposase/recombinase [Pseudoalteromonas sp. MT33b]
MAILHKSVWEIDSEKHNLLGTYRVLDVIEASNALILVEIPTGSSVTRPFLFEMDEFERLLKTDRVRKQGELQPLLSEDEIPTKWKVKRDENYNLIAPLVHSPTFLYELASQNRVKTIANYIRSLADPKSTASSIYRLLSKYYSYGSSKNALLPKYWNVGNKGKEKVYLDKLGGRNPSIKVYGQTPQKQALSNQDKDYIKASLNKLKRQRHQKVKFTSLYEDFCIARYFDEIEQASEERRPARVPTLRQFKYFVNKHLSLHQKTTIEKGDSFFEGNVKQLSSCSTSDTYGPGSVFQVDATVADVHLISSQTQKHIGRPTIYCLIDVHTRLIVSFYIGTKAPSWETAQLMFWYLIAEKSELLNRFGIEYKPEQWPCSSLPAKIVADRGEFIGKKPENSLPSLGVALEFTPPFRGDLKAIVEKRFDLFNGTLHELDGTTKGKLKKRDEKSPSLKAVLNLKDFGNILIRDFIAHNNQVLDGLLDVELYKRNIAPTPINYWEHLVNNNVHELHSIEQSQLIAGLLDKCPRFHITREGIVVRELVYTSPAFRELINQHGSRKLNSKGECRMKKEDPSCIYFRENDRQSYIKLGLASKHAKFNGLIAEDVIEIQKWMKSKKREAEQQVIKLTKRKKNQDILSSARTHKSKKGSQKAVQSTTTENRKAEPNIMTLEVFQEKPHKTSHSSKIDLKPQEEFDEKIQSLWDDSDD